MTDLKTAAQQVLDAWNAGDTKWFKLAYLVMDDLRRALAEPVQDGKCHFCTDGCPACDARKLPVQEPVAGRAFLERILTAMEGVIDVADRKTDEFDALRSCVIDLTLMLHTAPPQRRPLSEEEILSLFRTSGSPVLFARAIERAHNIKE